MVHADRTALHSAGEVWSYREIFSGADRVAREIVAAAGDPAQPVLLGAASGRTLLQGILGTLKAGRAYIALEANEAQERLSAIVAEAGVSLAVADHESRPLLDAASPDLTVQTLDGRPDLSAGPVWTAVSPDSPARIRFTSGSTGRPKGTIRTYDGLQRSLERATGAHRPSQRVGILRSATMGITGAGLLRPIVDGATVCTFDPHKQGSEALADWLVDARIQDISIVPTVLRRLLDSIDEHRQFNDIEVVRAGGEALFWSDVGRIRKHIPATARIVNSYGMSEAGMVSRYEVPQTLPMDDGPVPVGKPIGDWSVEIIDKEGHRLGPGATGRIVLSGSALGTGYLGNVNADQWGVRDAVDDATPSFASGDLGRLDDDGCLEVLGRADDTINIGGQRVEPTEVEDAIRAEPSIREAAVIAVPSAGASTRLVAFIVSRASFEVDAASLRRSLAGRLPTYMLPATVVTRQSLPLLPSGKPDRNVLQQEALHAVSRLDGAQSGKPMDELEVRLAELWAHAVGVVRVGRDDDFFELGGTSLAAASLFAKIEREFGVDLDISLLLDAPTVGALAKTIRSGERESAVPVVVRFHEQGGAPPLFCVHPAGGTVLLFRHLADRLTDRPVYGLQSPLLSGEPVDDDSVRGLARRYVSELQAVRPSGPYHLLGHSLGSLIAAEMACQLVESGEEVGLVGIGDISATPSRLPRWLTLKQGRRVLRAVTSATGSPAVTSDGRTIKQRLWWRTRKQVEPIRAQAHLRRHGLVPQRLRETWIWRVHGRARRLHRPRQYPGRLTVLLSSETADEGSRGWAAYARDGVDVLPLRGTHQSMWDEANIAWNAKTLAEVLKCVDSAVGRSDAHSHLNRQKNALPGPFD